MPTILSFKQDLAKFAEQMDVNIVDAVRKITEDLFARIIGNFPAHRHPVKTGRARSGWALSIGVPSGPPVPPVGTYGPPSIDVSQIDGKHTVYLLNNLPYIERLERGSSTQAPDGFVGLALLEIETELEALTL